MAPGSRKRPDMHSNSRRSASKSAPGAYDVIIIGGGLAGGTLASLLGTQGFRVACIDRDAPASQTKEEFDGRTIAISWGSRKVLEAAGLWDRLNRDACPIRTIDILDGGSPVLLRFASEEVGNRSFGWITENRLLRMALFRRMEELDTVDHIAPMGVRGFIPDDNQITVELENGSRLTGQLVIGADGRNSFTREHAGIGTRGWTYHQHAIVCTVTHEGPHNNTAVEHFRDQGPFAVLPMNDAADGSHRSSIVWTEHGSSRHGAMQYDQDTFDAALTARFPASYGRVRQTGGRFSYPLGLQTAHQYIAPRVALVADAAHGIHPIAGQGLNMGFRDIAALSQILGEARDQGADPGSVGILKTYEQERRFDNMAMAGTTDGLNRLFSNSLPPLPLMRKAGLAMVARVPAAKRFFMHQAMGAAGLLPDMIREAKGQR